MHTNYDVCRMGEICSRRLQLQETEILEVTEERADGVSRGIGTAGFLTRRMTAEECCAQVKRAFGLEQVRIFGDPAKKCSGPPSARDPEKVSFPGFLKSRRMFTLRETSASRRH